MNMSLQNDRIESSGDERGIFQTLTDRIGLYTCVRGRDEKSYCGIVLEVTPECVKLSCLAGNGCAQMACDETIAAPYIIPVDPCCRPCNSCGNGCCRGCGCGGDVFAGEPMQRLAQDCPYIRQPTPYCEQTTVGPGAIGLLAYPNGNQHTRSMHTLYGLQNTLYPHYRGTYGCGCGYSCGRRPCPCRRPCNGGCGGGPQYPGGNGGMDDTISLYGGSGYGYGGGYGGSCGCGSRNGYGYDGGCGCGGGCGEQRNCCGACNPCSCCNACNACGITPIYPYGAGFPRYAEMLERSRLISTTCKHVAVIPLRLITSVSFEECGVFTENVSG